MIARLPSLLLFVALLTGWEACVWDSCGTAEQAPRVRVRATMPRPASAVLTVSRFVRCVGARLDGDTAPSRVLMRVNQISQKLRIPN